LKKVIARIISNDEVAEGFFKMKVASGYLGRTARPGQFVELRCSGASEPLLRRPLGVHRIAPGGIDILYRVVGRGTAILSAKAGGESADIIGPLGNGFDIGRSGPAVLVAGGIGVAPLVALAQRLKRAHVIIGGRTSSHILCGKEFRSLGCSVEVATEDGSMGHKGLATELLEDYLRAPLMDGRVTVFACGPNPMLKTVAAIARSRRIRCQVSLEERMACGAGVCLGCPVKVKPDGAYKMVCKDGPVFEASEVAW
jgi:dihydroorotate dehydrogenase electron transfer subunit